MKNRLASRKLWVFIGTALTLISSVFVGDATWGQIAWPLVSALLVYLGIQGAVDIKAAGTPPVAVSGTVGEAVKAVGVAPIRELPADPRKWEYPKDIPGILSKFDIKIKL